MTERRNVSGERDPLTDSVIGAAIEVHRELGPGLMESAYEECLEFELQERGFAVQRQLVMPVVYKTKRLKKGYKIDLLIEKKLIVELKTIDRFMDVHESQVLTYLRLSTLKTALLLNFQVPMLKLGIRRFVM